MSSACRSAVALVWFVWRSGSQGRRGARTEGLRRPEQPALFNERGRRLREQDRRADRRDLGAQSTLHLVGPAARLCSQHA